MKQSKLLIPTVRNTPSEGQAGSHQLLLRAGFIRQVSSGIYMYLPLAYRVIEKVKGIIREEFTKIDGTELTMPTLLPKELWDNSDLGKIEDLSYKVTDRNEREFLLGTDYEQLFTSLIGNEVPTYKRLPLNLFQIQTMYSDVVHPRFGLLRSREIMMCHGYSFHDSEMSLETQFRQYEQALKSILMRCELEFKSVLGDSDLPGSKDTKEFAALSEWGLETICLSDESDYAANLKRATSLYTAKKSHARFLPLEKITVANQSTLSEVANFLEIDLRKTLKSYFFIADEEPILLLIRGDHELNLAKLKNFLNYPSLREGTKEEAMQYFATDSEHTAFGPIDASNEVTIYADLYVQDMVNFLVRSDEANSFYKNANIVRDFQPSAFEDFRLVQEGDLSPDGFGEIIFKKGIEIGKMFKAGNYYSKKNAATVSDQNGHETLVQMGCYQINISRLLAVIVEQNSDENGLSWPREIAPFDVHLLQMNMEDDYQSVLMKEVKTTMERSGYEVLEDDRNERPGVKFVEADLIGCPIRITIGKKAVEGIVELKIKKTGAAIEVRKEELADALNILLTAD